MDTELNGKVAVVTGAGKGIGHAVAMKLAALGARVALVARTKADLARTAKVIEAAGGVALPIAGNLTDEAFVTGMFAQVEAAFGRLDILVNNAGMAPFGPVEEVPVARLRECLELNVCAVYACMQQAIRRMRRQETGGKIINIGSVRARWTEAGDCGAYNASKYAVYALTETVARQLHGSGANIAVGMVNPGVVNTTLTNPKGEPRPDWLTPDEVAEAVLHAVTAPAKVNVFETVLFSMTQKPW